MEGFDLGTISRVYLNNRDYSFIYLGNTLVWPNYAKSYLTIVSTSDNNIIRWKANNSQLLKTISVSTDKGQTWTDKTSSTSGMGTELATLNTGDKLLIKGNNTSYGARISVLHGNVWEYAWAYNQINSSNTFDIEGNIMSLIYGDNYIGQTAFTDTYTFYELFSLCIYLNSAKNLVLPATTLTTNCYLNMFEGCTGLTTAPALPATTLESSCYYSMFKDCTSLTAIPLLPATTLANECYASMFKGCTSLVYPHLYYNTLPATTLSEGCYKSMFEGCTSLALIPLLPATTLANECYASMFKGCTSLLFTMEELPATTLAYRCYEHMFEGCTSFTDTPFIILPATTLATGCYDSMFKDCTNLIYGPVLPATTLADNCYESMFYGCTTLRTAPELPAETLVYKCYCNMFRNCTLLHYIHCLATDISASNCTAYWVSGVAATGTFEKNPNMTSWTTGSSGIPTGWTVTDDPDVPIVHDYSQDYLTIVSLANNNTISLKTDGTEKTVSISTDDGVTWTNYNSSSAGTVLATLDTDEKLLIKGSNSSYMNNYFTATGNFNVEGNIMSLLYGDNFAPQIILPSWGSTFSGLFMNCTTLLSAENLILPATTLASNCYENMFYRCSSLTTPPKVLPALILTNGCYQNMFYSCQFMTEVPQILATTMGSSSCSNMFRMCIRITTMPDLQATTLNSYCYNRMFMQCTRLVNVKPLPATTLASSCYSEMFSNCTSLVTAPEIYATTLASDCCYQMFYQCSSLTTVPNLPATTLVTFCYHSMFYFCTSLNYIKCLATDISASNCLTKWLMNASSTGTFVKDINTTYPVGDSGIPSGWTIQNA